MVVALGVTLIEPLARLDVKVPGVMATRVAPLDVQLNVLLVPALTLVGFAAKALMVGIAPWPDDDGFEELPPQATINAQSTMISVARTPSSADASSGEPCFHLQEESRKAISVAVRSREIASYESRGRNPASTALSGRSPLGHKPSIIGRVCSGF